MPRRVTVGKIQKDGRIKLGSMRGSEQGDPLMPLLFSLAIHNALEEVRGQMQEEELLFAFLDDIYIVSSPVRTRAIYDLLQDHLHRMAGIQLHEGKTRVWNRAGVCPPNVADLGDEVWSPRGVKILGTPVGSPEFIHPLTMERLEEERQLWKAIDWVPDLQCAWQILVQCAGPRCHHYVRTVPPSESRAYAEGHDTGMLETMRVLLGGLTGDEAQKDVAQRIATRFGLGLRSASRMSHAAYWASWADSLQMIAQRLPTVAAQVLANLADDQEAVGCLAELEEATRRLDHEGFVSRPGWTDLRDGARPPQVQSSEPGEWQHGWQYHTSSSSEHHYREIVVLAQSSAADQAHLRCQFRLTRLPFWLRVPDTSGDVPGADFGEIAPSTPCHRCPVRMWCACRPLGPSQRGVPPLRSPETESNGSRAHLGPSLQGSGSPPSVQRQVEGHECRGPSGR